jgi:amidase
MAQRRRLGARCEPNLGPADVAPYGSFPKRATDTIEVEYRNQAMRILCIAGLGDLPQISLPLGLSIVGWRGADLELPALAEKLSPAA